VSQSVSPTPAAPSNGLATAALVLGIIGVVLAVIPVIGIVGAILGGVGFLLAIFGILAARKHGVGKGKSIAGLVLGVLSGSVFIAVSAATVAAVDSVSKEIEAGVAAETDKSATSDTSQAGELKDVEVGAPYKDDLGGLVVRVTLTNHSKKVSDYDGTIVFEAPNGSKQYGTTDFYVDELRPGQTKVEEVMLWENMPSGVTRVTARVTDFDRHMSW
jgi:hypothetical protein